MSDSSTKIRIITLVKKAMKKRIDYRKSLFDFKYSNIGWDGMHSSNDYMEKITAMMWKD